jgi:hypothetical protein
LRQATFKAKALKRGHHISAGEAVPDVNGQALAGKQIEDGQAAESSPIRQLIRDKVHAPDVIARGGRSSLLAMHRGRVAPWALPAQRQPLLDIEAIAALLAKRPAFAPQQDEQPAVAKPHACLRQLTHPLPQRCQRIAAALIADAGQAKACGADRVPLTDFVAAHQVVHHFALLDGL